MAVAGEFSCKVMSSLRSMSALSSKYLDVENAEEFKKMLLPHQSRGGTNFSSHAEQFFRIPHESDLQCYFRKVMSLLLDLLVALPSANTEHLISKVILKNTDPIIRRGDILFFHDRDIMSGDPSAVLMVHIVPSPYIIKTLMMQLDGRLSKNGVMPLWRTARSMYGADIKEPVPVDYGIFMAMALYLHNEWKFGDDPLKKDGDVWFKSLFINLDKCEWRLRKR